jgi:hypothetical protein
MSHTKGPWSVDVNTGIVFGADGKPVQTGGFHCSQETKDNALLIASAPDLLTACEELYAEFHERLAQEGFELGTNPASHYSEGFNKMLLAVKKAKGLSKDLG